MKRIAAVTNFNTRFLAGILLAGMTLAPLWSQGYPTTTPPANPGRAAANPPRPGSVNYLEGQASLGATPLDVRSIGTLEVAPNQSLTTQTGRVEILLTPGVFLRLADNSALTMITPDLTNTEVRIDKGRAVVEVVEIHRENNIRIAMKSGTTQLLKSGLYDFDADHDQVRVFNGSAEVTAGAKHTKLGKGHLVTLTAPDLKSAKFEARAYEDDFYRWCGLRAGYVSEASMDAARLYIGGGSDVYAPGWAGWGWYWDPWFDVYTFLPADGVFYGAFGWGFYSPLWVFRSPYFFSPRYPHGFGEYHYPYGHGFPTPGRGLGGHGFPPPGRERGGLGGRRR